MKTLTKIVLPVISIILMGSGCEKDHLNMDVKPCNLSNMVKAASNLRGTIWFNPYLKSHAIYVGTEGSYDSQDVGIACNLPDEYQIDGLKIIFSGKCFKYEKAIFQQIPGQTYYRLELSKIVLDENNLHK